MDLRKLSKGMRLTLWVLIAAVTLCGYVFYIDFNTYRHLIQEDGIIENTGVLALSCLALVVIFRYFKVSNERGKRWKVFNILIILALIFVIGEEISWGQRLFGWKTNEFFSSNNLQGETNIHNLELYGLKLNKVIFSAALYYSLAVYFFFSKFFYKSSKVVHELVDSYGIPIPTLRQTLILLASTALVSLIPDSKKWELWEALLPMIVFLIWLNPYNKKEKLLIQHE